MDNATRRTIKKSSAYNLNMAREEEVCITVIENTDGTFDIDTWGCAEEEEEIARHPKLDGLTLTQTLSALDKIGASWYIQGL